MLKLMMDILYIEADRNYSRIFPDRKNICWLQRSKPLYQGDNLGSVEMKDYFINLRDSILDSPGAHKRVQVECVMNALNVDVDTAVPLGLTVNELLTNTIKYAFPAVPTGLKNTLN